MVRLVEHDACLDNQTHPANVHLILENNLEQRHIFRRALSTGAVRGLVGLEKPNCMHTIVFN